ncbi:N-acetylglucosaminyl-phosphatidylinositol de-N-acetylase-like [Acanthaster planci]|uniref:N-acetylglucosaminylphosphatidylinositol deacetylase n=1 Tax=Acanthaster planci TaxID=133434 RepID=A0A8B7ZDA2_ACAPL|nr:N-acetylglucosaminyl-phosphatidylinositol de-N-acetylase-like [Acanthaster planci]
MAALGSGLAYFFLPAYAAISLVIYYLSLRRKKSEKKNGKAKNVLLVTAHPDDECMFFSPTILQLTKEPHTELHLLCLSTGNYNNLGAVREKELIASCNILGIAKSDNITLLNDEKLQDNPDVFWDLDVAGEQILKQVKKYDISAIFTFDGAGVSGHKNHISCYTAVRTLMESHKLPKGIKLYFLQSVSILRKYLSFLDLPFSMLLQRHMFLAGPRDIWTAQQAMRAHASQFVWFRVLYVVFSRFMMINGYHKKSVH